MDGNTEKSRGFFTCMVISKMITAAEMLALISTSRTTLGIGTTSITTMAMTAAGTPIRPERLRKGNLVSSGEGSELSWTVRGPSGSPSWRCASFCIGAGGAGL
jgi:hypothetical protein